MWTVFSNFFTGKAREVNPISKTLHRKYKNKRKWRRKC